MIFRILLSVSLKYILEKDGIEAHWGHHMQNMTTLILSALVKFDVINWQETFLANLNISTGIEKEITLLKDTIIKVNEINLNSENIEIPNLQFLA
jgi:hypothetical protein